MLLTKFIFDPYYNAYAIAQKAYGKDIASNAEKIMKLESANYKSSQFKNGYSAGMLAFATKFPYGWETLKSFWTRSPWARPVGIYSTNATSANDGKTYQYLKFPSFRAALITLCERLNQIGNDPAKWNGGVDNNYASAVASIKNDYVV